MGRSRTYTEEFKKEAVLLVLEGGYSIAKASKNLEVSAKNISRCSDSAKLFS